MRGTVQRYQLLGLAILFIVVSTKCDQCNGPQIYPMAFMNITSDRTQVCVIQIYGYAPQNTGLVVLADYTNFTLIDVLNQGTVPSPQNSFNYSPPFDSLLNKPDPANSDPVNNRGILLTSSMPMYVVGVKSDLGTTGAYYALPMVNESVEFFVAGWPKFLNFPFLAAIEIVASQDDTCIEIYKIFNGTDYVKVGSNETDAYQVYRYFATREILQNRQQSSTDGEDVTGYYINATKPVQVIFGHECAWVPDQTVLYCDYVTEQIPPVSQLGRFNVVPPIGGRIVTVGYIVRVVATAAGITTVSYLGNTESLLRGEFLQFEQPFTDNATIVVCSQNCLVMQYNKGYEATSEDEPLGSDPFMSLVVPDNRFTSATGFATANFCDGKNELIEFANFISLVTFASYKDSILVDGTPVNSMQTFSGWKIYTNGNVQYASTYFRVSHGFHVVTCTSNTKCSFAVYVYGHSTDLWSTSAYGFAANYNITGECSNKTWSNVQPIFLAAMNSSDGVGCSSADQLTGAIISNDEHASFPFTLEAQFRPPVDLGSCVNQYNNTFFKMLQDFSQKINTWICATQNCSFLSGKGVAINTLTLSVNWLRSQGRYTGVQIYVEMIASFDTSAQNFAQCRAEIKNYLYSFVNWPPNYSTDLLPQPAQSGCPWPLPFVQPMFVTAPDQCSFDPMAA